MGSSSYITNLDGNVTQHMEYLPFGETLVDEHQNSNNSPFKFNAKELDEETGNYYYGARYYNPKWSIWLSVDPMAEERQGMSPYNFVQNNPLNRIDPDGALDMAVEDVDDLIIQNKNGEELGRIILPGKDQYFTLDTEETICDPIVLNPIEDITPDMEAIGISFDLSFVVGGGATGGAEFTYFLEGKDKGNVYAYSNVAAALGFNGELGASLFRADFDSNSKSEFMNAKKYAGPYMGASVGFYASGDYTWSNEAGKFELFPNTVSQRTWSTIGIGGGLGGELGAKAYTGKKTILNQGRPVWQTK